MCKEEPEYYLRRLLQLFADMKIIRKDIRLLKTQVQFYSEKGWVWSNITIAVDDLSDSKSFVIMEHPNDSGMPLVSVRNLRYKNKIMISPCASAITAVILRDDA